MSIWDIGTYLFQAVVGVAKSKYDSYMYGPGIEEDIRNICSDIGILRESVARIVELVKDKEDPEVDRFRRAKEMTRDEFGRFFFFNELADESLIDFSAELLSTLVDGKIRGLNIRIECVVINVEEYSGYSYETFEAVITSSKMQHENLLQLRDFFTGVLRFNNRKEIPANKSPRLFVQISKSHLCSYEEFYRIRNRICIRLALLNSISIGWITPSTGSLTTHDGAVFCNNDKNFIKEVNDGEIPGGVVSRFCETLHKGDKHDQLREVIRNFIEKKSTTLQVIILSGGEWRDEIGFLYVSHITKNIREYFDHGNIHYLEARVTKFNDWDRIKFDHTLHWGISASLLVFRFDTIEVLAEMISSMRSITDRFPGLIAEEHRVIYVDTSTTRDFGNRRSDIQKTVKDRRMHKPRDIEDIFFEATTEKCNLASKEISARGKCKSLVSRDIKTHVLHSLEIMVRVLNKEIGEDEMWKESVEILELIDKARDGWKSSTKINQTESEIIINRGSALTIWGGSDLRNYMKETDYRSFRDIRSDQPPVMTVRIQLNGLPHGFLKQSLTRRSGKILKDLNAMVKEHRRLYIAVSGEKKIVRTVRAHRRDSKIRMLTNIDLRVEAGGAKEFLIAKLVLTMTEFVSKGRNGGSDLPARYLLKIIPDLKDIIG